MPKPYSESSWRNHAAPIIAKVLSETQPNSPERKKALHDAYPFRQRRYHPYKIWLDEIKKQTKRPVRFVEVGAQDKIVFPDAKIGEANTYTKEQSA